MSEIDYSTLHKDPRRYAYLERDCRLLYDCLQTFYGMVQSAGGEIGLTAPGTAMASFRRSSLTDVIPINRHYPECENADCPGCLHMFVRKAYYGGRVELYRERFTGPGSINVGDINSMYPWAMLGDVPCELACVREGEIDVERYSSHFLGFIDATLTVPRGMYLPPLPFRTANKLVFPTGTLSGVWTSAEILSAVRAGAKIDLLRKSVWFRGKPIFAEFVKHWYSYRDKSSVNYNEAMAHVAKLLLNSLYGKMGMNEERERLWFFPSESDCREHELTPLADAIAGVYSEETRSTAAYIIPHIAAWITSIARVRLFEIASDFLKRGYKIWYMDTDCVHTDAPLTNSNELGKLKLECEVSYAEYVAPKLYLLKKVGGKTEVKAKGFSGGFGAGAMTEAAFHQLVNHKAKVKISKMTKLREGLRATGRFPKMKIVEKQLNSIDTKRIHLPDGNTEALHIEESIQ